MAKPTSYDAFVSYSHAADGKLAPTLQRGLQRFATPWGRPAALHLFRDQTSLSASPEMWPEIERALTDSRFFLLLAAPQAAASPWVQQEVAWWLDHRSAETLLLALTDGHLVWDRTTHAYDPRQTDALPPKLFGAFRDEPLWVDLRWAQERGDVSPKDPRWQDALATLAAPLRGLSKEALINEDVRQRRRAMWLARGAVALLAFLLLVAVLLAFFTYSKQVEAKISKAGALASEALLARERNQDDLAALDAKEAFLQDDASDSSVLIQLKEALQAITGANDDAMWAPGEEALQATVGAPYFGHLLPGPESWVSSLAFSSNGSLLAAGSTDQAVLVWRLTNGVPHLLGALPAGQQPDRRPPYPNAIEAVAFSPADDVLATGGADHTVRLYTGTAWHAPWTAGAPTPVQTIQTDGHVLALAFSDDGSRLAAGTDNGATQVWDVTTPGQPTLVGTARQTAKQTGQQNVRYLRYLTLSTPGGANQVWNVSHPDRPMAIGAAPEADPNQVWSVAFMPKHNDEVASAGTSGQVQLWNPHHPETPPRILTAAVDPHSIWSVAFSHDGARVAGGSSDHIGYGTVVLWNVQQHDKDQSPQILQGHADLVGSVAFSRTGDQLASGGHDETVRLWDSTNAGPALAILGGTEQWVRALSFSPEGRWLASSGPNDTVRLWDLGDPAAGIAAPAILPPPVPARQGSENWVTSLAVASDGKTLAAGREDGQIALWPLGQPHATPTVLDGDPKQTRITALAFTDNNQRLISVSQDWTVRQWDIGSPHARPQPLALPQFSSSASITGIVMSRDGARLAASTDGGATLIWDLQGPDTAPTHLPDDPQIHPFAFNPDDRLLAATDAHGLHVWDLSDPLHPVAVALLPSGTACSPATGQVRAVAFSDDGLRLAASADAAICVWQWSGAEAAWQAKPILQGHDAPIATLAFSPDGDWLASGSEDQTLRLWNLQHSSAGAILGHAQGTVLALAFDSNGNSLIASSAHGSIRLWRLGDQALADDVCDQVYGFVQPTPTDPTWTLWTDVCGGGPRRTPPA